MPSYLPALTWLTASLGGGLALAAFLAKGRGWLGPVGAGRLFGTSYAFMGLSMALFALRGLGG
jgi:hypothetical protein